MLYRINKTLVIVNFFIFLLYVLHCLKLTTSEKIVLYGVTLSLPTLRHKHIPKWLLFGNITDLVRTEVINNILPFSRSYYYEVHSGSFRLTGRFVPHFSPSPRAQNKTELSSVGGRKLVIISGRFGGISISENLGKQVTSRHSITP